MGSIGNDGSGWQKTGTGTPSTFTPWYSQRQYGQYVMQPTLGGYQRPYMYQHVRHYPALFPTSTGSPQSQPVKPPMQGNILLDHSRATPSGTYFSPTRPTTSDRQSNDAELESDDGLSQVIEDDCEGVGDAGPTPADTSTERLREAKDLWDLRWSRWWGYNWSRKRDEAARKQRVQMSRTERIDRRCPSSSASIAGSQQRQVSCASVDNCVSFRFPNTSKSEPGSYEEDETPSSRESDSQSTIKRRVWQRVKKLCNTSKARAHALKENLANRRRSLFNKNQGKKLKEENLIDLDTNTNNKLTRPLIPDYLMEAESGKVKNAGVDLSRTSLPLGVEQENKNPRRESCKQATGISLDKRKLKEFELEPRSVKYFNSSDTSLASLEHLAMRLEQLKKTDDVCNIDKYSKPKHNENGVSIGVSKCSMINVSRGTSPISIFSAKPNRMSNSRAQQVYRLMVDKPTVPTMAQCMPTESAPNTNETCTKPNYDADLVTANPPQRIADMNRPPLPPREPYMTHTYLKQHSPHNVSVTHSKQSPLVTSPNTPTTAATVGSPLRETIKDIRTKEESVIYNAEEQHNPTYPSSRTLDKPHSTVNCQAINDMPTYKLKAPHWTKEKDSFPPSEMKMDGNDRGITGHHKTRYETNTLNPKGEDGQKLDSNDFMAFQTVRDAFKTDKPFIPTHQPLGNYRFYKPYMLPSYSGPPLLTPMLRSRVMSPSPSLLSSTMSSFMFPHHPSTYYPFPFMSPWLTPFAHNSNIFDDQGSMFPRKSRAETSDRLLRTMSTQTYEETFTMIDRQYQKLRTATSGVAVDTKQTCTKATQTENLENISSLQNTKPPAHISLEDASTRCHQTTSTHFTESCGTQTNLDEHPSKQTSPSSSESSLTQPKMVNQWLTASAHGRPCRMKKTVYLNSVKSRRECVHKRRSSHPKTPVELSDHSSLCDVHPSIVHEKRVMSNHSQNVMFAKSDRSFSDFTSLSNIADFPNASMIAIKSSRGICADSYPDKTPSPTSNEKHMVFIDYESLPEIKSSEEFETVKICTEMDQKENQATQTTKRSRKQKIKLFFRRKLSNLSSNSE